MDTCYKTSNNKYRDCPPRMSDGRQFTDYRPNCYLNNVIKTDNSITSSFDYRNFLKDNAEELMEINREYSCKMNCCGPCGEDVEEEFTSTMLPEQFKQVTNNKTAEYVLNDNKGLGLGRSYYKYPAEKCENLPDVWPKSKGENDCMTLPDKHMCYGDLDARHSLQRPALPGGSVWPPKIHPWDGKSFKPMDPLNNNFMEFNIV